ncbi:TonB family protein [Ereboglobus luteus]|nr:TonB family protein [Ereboglobus luteus]
MSTARADLRLVCEIDGKAFAPRSISGNTIEVTDGTETRQTGADATWRLEGDLRANAAFLRMSPNYTIYQRGFRHRVPGEKYPMRAKAGISHSQGGESEFLRQWPDGVSTSRALLVVVWMLDGRAADARVRIVPPTQGSAFIRNATFDLTREQAAAGQAVLLLWKDGRFFEPRQREFHGLDKEAVHAVIFDDAVRLQKLISSRRIKPMTAAKDGGLTLMHLAARAGSVRAMDVLIKAAPKLVRAEANEKSQRATPLELAIEKSRAEAVERLLRAKASVNLRPMTRSYASTPLSAAVASGHTGIVRALIEAGADLFGPRSASYSAFDTAVIGGDVGLMKTLLGGKPPSPELLADYKDSDVLRFQLRLGQVEMALWLIEQGLSPNNDETTLRTLLETADRQNDASFARLITKVVKPPESDAGGNAGATAQSTIGPDLLNTPLAVTSSTPNPRPANALIEAARADYPLLVRELVAAGFSLDETDSIGASALHAAAATNAVESMRVLLEHGASINATDSNGASALDRALAEDAIDAARLLVEKGARLDPEYKSAQKSLNAALRMDMTEIVMPMVDAGFPSDGKLYRTWTLRRAAEHYQARACLRALNEQPAAKGKTRRKRPTSIEPENYTHKLAMTAGKASPDEVDDPRNPFLVRPETTVEIKAVVDKSGRARFCTVEPLPDGSMPPLALQNAARHALEKHRFPRGQSGGSLPAYWVSFTCKFPALGDTPVNSTDEIDEMFVIQEPRAAPGYPLLAKQKKIPGHVLLAFVLNEKGRVEMVDVIKATPDFASSAVAAVKLWRFRPAKKDGVPVRALGVIPMQFTP